MQGKVEICGVNTSKLQTLSNAEMMRLIERSQQGDMDARSRLVEGNLKLVLSVVQRFLSRGENPDDLFQVGCIGLLKAIANFDTTKNVRFSTYGVPMIAGELRRYLRDYSPIRVSRSLRDTAYRVLQCRQQLTDQNGREPSIDEIAQALDLPPAQITAALDAITAPVSLYEPVYSEGGDALTVMDQVRDRKNTDDQANDRQRPQDARRITVHEHADDQQDQCQHGQKAIECVHPVSAHHPFCKPLSHDRSPFQAAEFDSCILSHVYEKYIKEL